MIFDVIIIIILVVPMALGIARGFIYTVLQTLGWIVGIAAAFFLTGIIAPAAKDGFLGAMVTGRLTETFDIYTEGAQTAADGLPSIISGGIKAGSEEVSDIFIDLLSSLIVTVTVFLLIAVTVRIIMRFIVRPASRRNRDGIINAGDRVLGMLAGFVKGILLVFVFLALLVPAGCFVSPETAAAVKAGLDSSYIAGTLYDCNLLLLVTGGFFS